MASALAPEVTAFITIEKYNWSTQRHEEVPADPAVLREMCRTLFSDRLRERFLTEPEWGDRQVRQWMKKVYLGDGTPVRTMSGNVIPTPAQRAAVLTELRQAIGAGLTEGKGAFEMLEEIGLLPDVAPVGQAQEPPTLDERQTPERDEFAEQEPAFTEPAKELPSAERVRALHAEGKSLSQIKALTGLPGKLIRQLTGA